MILKGYKDPATILHGSYKKNVAFPDSLRGTLSTDEAYDAQFQLLQIRQNENEKLVGWKDGLTSPAMQQQQGVHEPCLGHLIKSGQRHSPAIFKFNDLHSPGFENELCLRLKFPLEENYPSLENVANAVEAVAPALEIIERRSPFGSDFPLVIAGNAQQHAFVTGKFIPFSKKMDLAQTIATVSINGKAVETALGSEVLGNPLESVRWLAKKLTAFGYKLEAGMLVMTGSFTKQYSLKLGDQIKTDFDGIGATSAIFK